MAMHDVAREFHERAQRVRAISLNRPLKTSDFLRFDIP